MDAVFDWLATDGVGVGLLLTLLLLIGLYVGLTAIFLAVEWRLFWWIVGTA